MFRSKVFRDRAVARQSRPEPLDARLQVTAPHEWVALAALGVALLVLLLWAVLGTVQRSVAVAAVLVQPGERAAVAAPVSGVVVELLAEVGDAVGAGDPIARVRLPEVERQARITQRLVSVVEDGGPAGGDVGDARLRRQLLGAARRELREVELATAEFIVAPRAGWLAASRLTPSEAVRAGETIAHVRADASGAWQAFAFVSPADTGQIEAGMAAEVLATLPGDPSPRALAAQVLEVSPRPVAAPPWLEDFGLAANAPAHLLRLALSEAAPASLVDGAGGRVRVALAEQSLASLLLAGDA